MLDGVTPESFFEASLSRFQQAAQGRPCRPGMHYRFGSSHLSIDCLTPRLAEIFESGLGPGGPEPDLSPTRILAWDEEFTGVACPPPPWGAAFAYTRRGDIPISHDQRFRISYNYAANLLCLFDRQRRLGLYWTRRAGLLPGWECTAPLRSLLHWHGLEHGLQLTHGAVVGGLLLAGKGGSGKSTTALACLEAGWPFLCDDYCYTQIEPEPRAFAVFRRARILAPSLGWLPQTAGLAREPSDDKLSVDLSRQIVPTMALRALVLPGLPQQPVRAPLQPAEVSESIRGLVLPTMAQLPGAGAQSLAHLQTLCRKLPAYRLWLDRVPGLIPELLKGLAS